MGKGETMAEKVEMVSLKVQLAREKMRKADKLRTRMMKNPPIPQTPQVRMGNKDHGIPYHGKDRFGGMWKKFKDRIIPDYETEGITRLFVYQNNKYTED
jgi:hypothetical protein